jgi:hypothetical protein
MKRNPLLGLLVLSTLSVVLWLPAGTVFGDHANNRWEFYRWPWGRDETRTMTQGWNGATSHWSSKGHYYAIDVAAGTARPGGAR